MNNYLAHCLNPDRSSLPRFSFAALFAIALLISPFADAKAGNYSYYGVFADQPSEFGDKYITSNPDFSSLGMGFIAGKTLDEQLSLELRFGSLSDFKIGDGTNQIFQPDNFYHELALLFYPNQAGDDKTGRDRRFFSPFVRLGSARAYAVNESTEQ